jgi:hypothetical protein
MACPGPGPRVSRSVLPYTHIGPEGGGYDEYPLDPEFLDDSNVQ